MKYFKEVSLLMQSHALRTKITTCLLTADTGRHEVPSLGLQSCFSGMSWLCLGLEKIQGRSQNFTLGEQKLSVARIFSAGCTFYQEVDDFFSRRPRNLSSDIFWHI